MSFPLIAPFSCFKIEMELSLYLIKISKCISMVSSSIQSATCLEYKSKMATKYIHDFAKKKPNERLPINRFIPVRV